MTHGSSETTCHSLIARLIQEWRGHSEGVLHWDLKDKSGSGPVISRIL